MSLAIKVEISHVSSMYSITVKMNKYPCCIKEKEKEETLVILNKLINKLALTKLNYGSGDFHYILTTNITYVLPNIVFIKSDKNFQFQSFLT